MLYLGFECVKVIECVRVIEVMVLKDDDSRCWWCEGCSG